MQATRGSFTIEATGSLIIFVYAFVAILYFFNVAVTESIVQHALNQTAKEYAQYIYVSEKILTVTKTSEGITNGENIFAYLKQLIYETNSNDSTEANDNNIDDFMNNIILLSDTLRIGEIKEQLVGEIITPVMRKYINNAKSMAEAHENLLAHNIVNGLYGLDFRGSSLLKNGKQIALVVEYEIEPSFWRFFHKKLSVRQTASTGVWIKGISDDDNEHKLGFSKWHLPPLERGKEFLKEVRANNYELAVKPGYGIDLYDNGKGQFYFSLNLFSAHYAFFNNDDNTYTLNSQNILTQLRTYVQKINSATVNLSSSIEMENGTVQSIDPNSLLLEMHMIVPEEAIQFMSELQTITETIRNAYGINIEWHFQEKYFL